MYLVFDTETTGLIGNKSAPYTDEAAWPRVVQLAWQLHDLQGVLVEQADFLIRPDGFNIPFKAESIHGISTALAQAEGVASSEALIAYALGGPQLGVRSARFGWGIFSSRPGKSASKRTRH
jgi:DNA polymerase-3 subunit alpha